MRKKTKPASRASGPVRPARPSGPARPATEPLATAAPLSEEAALLALAATPVPGPSPAVKTRLLARIRASKRETTAATPAVLSAAPAALAVPLSPLTAPAAPVTAPVIPSGWRFESARSAEGWHEPFPGVRFKTLSVDDERDVVMLLVAMAPGSRFPDHPHDLSADEGVVISGDVAMDGRLMLPGDYYYAGLGTMHLNITSPSGCTALLSLRASAWRRWQTKPAASP